MENTRITAEKKEFIHFWAETMLREIDHIRNNDLYSSDQQLEMSEYAQYLRDIHINEYKSKQPPEWYKKSRKFYFEIKQYLHYK